MNSNDTKLIVPNKYFKILQYVQDRELIWDDFDGNNRYTHVINYKLNKNDEHPFIKPVHIKYNVKDNIEVKKLIKMLLTINKPNNTISYDEIKNNIMNGKGIKISHFKKQIKIKSIYLYIHRLTVAFNIQLQLLNILLNKSFKHNELPLIKKYININDNTSIIICLALQHKKIDIINEYIERYHMHDLYKSESVRNINSLIGIVKYIVGCHLKLTDMFKK